MFLPTHMAVGALVESVVKRRAPTAAVAIASHTALDITIFWHAPYEWTVGSQAIVGEPRAEIARGFGYLQRS